MLNVTDVLVADADGNDTDCSGVPAYVDDIFKCTTAVIGVLLLAATMLALCSVVVETHAVVTTTAPKRATKSQQQRRATKSPRPRRRRPPAGTASSGDVHYLFVSDFMVKHGITTSRRELAERMAALATEDEKMRVDAKRRGDDVPPAAMDIRRAVRSILADVQTPTPIECAGTRALDVVRLWSLYSHRAKDLSAVLFTDQTPTPVSPRRR